MTFLKRRRLLAGAAATLAAASTPRNSQAALPRLADLHPGTPVPGFAFQSADGATLTLSDYLGRGVVLNFWATWCAPCVREMPSLARLAGAVGDSSVAVLPLSSDRGGAPVVDKYFAEHAIAGLPVLLDPRSEAAHAFGARGLPTTVLIDAQGRERARYEGAAEWDDPAAVAAVKELARS